MTRLSRWACLNMWDCDHYPDLGDVVDRCLTAEGRGLIHTIGRNRPRLMNAWIEKRIFPGAYPPTLGEMMDIFEPHRFLCFGCGKSSPALCEDARGLAIAF